MSAKLRGVDATRTLLICLLIAGNFGFYVAGIAIYLVPGSGAGSYYIVFPQWRTQSQIERTMRSLDEFRAKHGYFPATLSGLNVSGRDGWGRSLRHSLVGGKPLVESLGQDGFRGGRGLDADLSNQNLRPLEANLSLQQKLEQPLAQPMIGVAILCGLVSGISVFSSLKNTPRPQSWLAFAGSLLVSFGIAVVGAVFITMVHIPSGH